MLCWRDRGTRRGLGDDRARDHPRLPVDVVRRGAFVALKFHAAISPTRQIQDKYQGLADIGNVLARQFTAEDERLAATIAAEIHPGAKQECETLSDDMRRGRLVKI